MDPALLPHVKRERMEYYNLENEDFESPNSFSDFQKSVLRSHDTDDDRMWTAPYVSLDQSDRVSLD